MSMLRPASGFWWWKKKRATVPDYVGAVGGLAAELWHSQRGVSGATAVASIVGQVQGALLSAPVPNRMSYAVDGANFGGKKVMHSSTSATTYAQNIATAALLADGSRPHVFSVMRWKTHPATTRWAFRAVNTAGSQGGPGWLHTGGTTLNGETWGPAIAFTDTAVHAFEFWLDAAGVAVMAIDGVTVGTSGTGQSLSGARTKWAIASNTAGGSVPDAVHGLHMVNTTVPSPAQRAALLALARAEFTF